MLTVDSILYVVFTRYLYMQRFFNVADAKIIIIFGKCNNFTQ